MAEIMEIQEKLAQVRADTLCLLEGLTQEQLDASPGRGDGWSLGEIFMHLAIDEFYMRELIARPLLAGIRPPEGIHFIPPPPPYGTPKGTIRFWFERARAGTVHLLENIPEDADLTRTHSGGLEPMNGLAWFLAYAGHEAFHHQQINASITARQAQ